MKLQVEVDGELYKLELQPGEIEGTYLLTSERGVIEADAQLLQPGVLSLLIDGRAYRCILDAGGETASVSLDGQQHEYRMDDPRSLRSRRSRAVNHEGARPVKASMPGRVVRVLVEEGESVEAQQAILVIEAMKMQNEVKSPKDGTLAELRVSAGEAVASGQVLAVIE